MAIKIDTKFEGKLIYTFKNDMKNFGNFYQSTFASLKIVTLMGPFCLKIKMYVLKICRGVMCHDKEE